MQPQIEWAAFDFALTSRIRPIRQLPAEAGIFYPDWIPINIWSSGNDLLRVVNLFAPENAVRATYGILCQLQNASLLNAVYPQGQLYHPAHLLVLKGMIQCPEILGLLGSLSITDAQTWMTLFATHNRDCVDGIPELDAQGVLLMFSHCFDHLGQRSDLRQTALHNPSASLIAAKAILPLIAGGQRW